MRTSSFVLPVIILTSINSCQQKPSAPDAATIESLNLKRGSVISCGPGNLSLGKVRFETSCKDALKQDFDLGVAFLHSFEYDEAEKVFAKIIDADASCPMAYWGVAMANYHTLWAPPNKEEFDKASHAISIAKSLNAGTDREKAYINSIASFYENSPKDSHAARYAKFEQSVGELYKNYPDDPEAGIFYSLVLTGGADPADKQFVKQRKAVSILRELYKAYPDHPGIIHYIIHSFDNPQLASLALPEARKYASIAPSSAHAQHMPSHIFTRLGLWKEDVKSNRDAANSAKCYAESTGITGHWDEELHSLDYLVYAYLQMGDTINAGKEVDYLKAMKSVTPVNGKVAYAFAAIPARYVLENREWKQAAALKFDSSIVDWKKYPWEKAIVLFATALGQANTGQTAKAQSTIREIEIIRDGLLDQKDLYKANQVAVQVSSANAWLLFRSGKTDEGLALMQKAAEMEDKTQKHPVTPGEVLPARELLGDMLLAMNRPAEALVAYEADLVEHPNRYNGLLGAATAAAKSNNVDKHNAYLRKLAEVKGQAGHAVALFR